MQYSTEHDHQPRLPSHHGDARLGSGYGLRPRPLPKRLLILTVAQHYRLRYRLTLRDLSEILALRGIEVSHEAVRYWETKLLPVLGDELRKRRHGTRSGSGTSN